MIKKHNYTWIVVEDNHDDFIIIDICIKQITKEIDVVIDLVHQKDHVETYNYLLSNNKCDLLLLDINLPIKNGLDILAELDRFKYSFPVIVMSTSVCEEEIKKAYSLGCSAFVPKLSDLSEVISSLNHIIEFYCLTVITPGDFYV